MATVEGILSKAHHELTGSERLLLKQVLADVQGNIIRAHARRDASYVFLGFDDAASARATLRLIAPYITSAADVETQRRRERFSRARLPRWTAVGVGLSASGEALLGLDAGTGAFADGLRARVCHSSDDNASPDDDVHMVISIAADTRRPINDMIEMLADRLPHGFADLTEHAHPLPNGTEPFGFADGLSGPVLLHTDGRTPARGWDPVFPFGQVLITDDRGGPHACASFMVFAKFEQHLDAFHHGSDDEAQVARIGRSRAGVSLAVSDGTTTNAFDYADDPDGEHCPRNAHVRKVNPRHAGGEHRDAHRAVQFVRRGLPWKCDDRAGLLFVGFNRDLEQQFETMYLGWMLHDDASAGGPGPDALTPYISLLDGYYFRMPSKSAIDALAS